jgi:hypothetical protein
VLQHTARPAAVSQAHQEPTTWQAQGVQGQALIETGAPESLAVGQMQRRLPTQLLWSVQCVTASQGTLVYLPPSSCVEGARMSATAAQSARRRTGRWGTRLSARHTSKRGNAEQEHKQWWESCSRLVPSVWAAIPSHACAALAG